MINFKQLHPYKVKEDFELYKTCEKSALKLRENVGKLSELF